VGAFSDEVKVEVGKHGGEAVGVFKLALAALFYPQAIWENPCFARKHNFKKTLGVNALQRENSAVPDNPDPLGAGQEGAHGDGQLPAHLNGMRTENMKGVGVFSPQEEVDLLQGCSRLGQEFSVHL
jgi:hypothetical protein